MISSIPMAPAARTAIVWTADMEIGISAIDDQHKSLVNLANVLHALFGTIDRTVIDAALRQLIDYVELHFATEEQLMQELAYAGAAGHARTHALISARVDELWNQRGDLTPEELFELLADWVLRHIRAEVAEFAAV